MRLVYIDDMRKDVSIVEKACIELNRILSHLAVSGVKIDFEYIEPDGVDDDFIYWGDDGLEIKNNPNNLPSMVDSEYLLKKSTVDRILASSSELFFLLDINFAGNNPLLAELTQYGLHLATYLSKNGVSADRIILFTLYEDHARSFSRELKNRPWFDTYSKSDFDMRDADKVLASRLAHKILEFADTFQIKALQPSPDAIRSIPEFSSIIGESPKLITALKLAQSVAREPVTVLITGESGTGKELIARAIHNLSDRKLKPFVAFSIASLNEMLMESELFGHEKGSFTGALELRRGKFELADRGTIFLDEIGEVDRRTQVKLLRVLEERNFERVGGTTQISVDVRVIAATNRNLSLEVREGRFREDLFHRLNVFVIKMPPLRERKEDIPLLVEYFRVKYDRRMRLGKEVVKALNDYNWEGNVRQLGNIIQSAIIHAKAVGSDTIEVAHLQIPGQEPGHTSWEETFNRSIQITGHKNFLTAFKKLIEIAGSPEKTSPEAAKLILQIVLQVIQIVVSSPEMLKKNAKYRAARVIAVFILGLHLDKDGNQSDLIDALLRPSRIDRSDLKWAEINLEQFDTKSVSGGDPKAQAQAYRDRLILLLRKGLGLL